MVIRKLFFWFAADDPSQGRRQRRVEADRVQPRHVVQAGSEEEEEEGRSWLRRPQQDEGHEEEQVIARKKHALEIYLGTQGVRTMTPPSLRITL